MGARYATGSRGGSRSSSGVELYVPKGSGAMGERHTNWFVRILIVVLCAFLATLVGYRFFNSQPFGDLSVGVLVVLALIIVLVLSESFDNFSVGKLLSLTREVQKHQADVSDLKRENLDLRGQLVSVATSVATIVSQRQTSTNILGLPEPLARALGVTPAPEEEVREKQAEEQRRQIPAAGPPPARPDQRKFEDKAIERFLQSNNLQQFPVVRDPKLMAQIQALDPISTSSPIFDGYLNTLDAEVFIEVRPTGRLGLLMYRERLYLMLSKLYHYRTLKKVNVYLALLLVALPGDEPKPDSVSRVLSEFQPAISSGLLRVVEISLTEPEAAELYVQPPGT